MHLSHQAGWHCFTNQHEKCMNMENTHRRRMHNTNCDCLARLNAQLTLKLCNPAHSHECGLPTHKHNVQKMFGLFFRKDWALFRLQTNAICLVSSNAELFFYPKRTTYPCHLLHHLFFTQALHRFLQFSTRPKKLHSCQGLPYSGFSPELFTRP